MNKLKYTALVGVNASFSYNRILLQYMKKRYQVECNIQIAEISQIPLFNEDEISCSHNSVSLLASQLAKSVLEWMSSSFHPFKNKPVMIVGASYGVQGTVRAQINLRQILDSPGLQAKVLPGHEFMLYNTKEQFNKEGQLTNHATISFLDSCIKEFNRYVTFSNI